MTTSTQVIGLKVIRSDMLCHGERIQARAQPRRRILRVSHSDTGAVSEPFNDTTARQFCRRKRVRTLVKGQKNTVLWQICHRTVSLNVRRGT